MSGARCTYPVAVLAAALLAVVPGARADDTLEGVAGPYGERLRYDEKGLTLSFPEQEVRLQIGGRLQIDAGAAGVGRFGPPGAFSDNVAVRRAWIEPTLTIGRDWVIAFQYDLNDGVQPINDAFVAWKGLADTIVTLGNMKVPFSLEWLQSNNDTLFTERSLANAFVPDRQFGAAVGRNGRDWTATAMVFGGTANDGVTGDGIAAAARATWAPVMSEDETLHLGLAGIYRSRSRSDGDFSFNSRAEAFLFGRPFVDTGTLPDVSAVSRVGLEAAYRNGPFLVQGEVIRAEVERFGGQASLGFQGGYVEGAVVLNGPGRAYALVPQGGTTYATFKGVRVPDDRLVSRGGPGVFELAARLSAIDLNDRALRGGSERDASLGLNWYPEANIRLTADYVHGEVRPGSAQSGLGTRPFAVDTLITRFQLFW